MDLDSKFLTEDEEMFAPAFELPDQLFHYDYGLPSGIGVFFY